jgi:glycosyltransferase involved in cell wall biosynthesis
MLLKAVTARLDAILAWPRSNWCWRDTILAHSRHCTPRDACHRPDVIDYVGTPADADLAKWYQRAAVFAYPSLYEGFGLPVVRRCTGTPVVATNGSSLPEVITGAAELIAPGASSRPWLVAEAMLLRN